MVAWRADPATTNPRLLERLRLDRAARGARTFVVVDAERTATAQEADASVELDAARDFEALWALRALVAGTPLDRHRAGDLPLDALDGLAERVQGVDHVAFLHGALDELGALALFSLVRDLSHDRHAVMLALRGEGNARGAEDVLAWQTGFPSAVSFARGYPRANPGEFSAAELLDRREVDAALVIGANALPGLRELPTVVIDTEGGAVGARRLRHRGRRHRRRRHRAPHGRRARPAARAARRRPAGDRGRAGRDRGAAVMLRIAGGRVYDPANGIAGEVRDVCVQDGRIVDDVPAHARSIDARGMVVMPGGVDIHAHIAGPKVNAARKLLPEEHRADVFARTAIARAGSGGTVPSTFATGYRYALLGYTTVVEAATPPLAARHTLAELRDTPVIDALFLILMGNNLALFELIRSEPAACARRSPGGCRPPAATASSSSTRAASRCGSAATATSPRSTTRAPGSRRARSSRRSPPPSTSSACPTRSTSTATTSAWRATAARRSTRCARWRAAAPTSPTCSSTPTAGEPGGRPRSRAPELAEYLNAHPKLSADIGQVMFGEATTMTADAPVSAVLREITGRWVNADTEVETGCGIVPFAYRERNYVHALQWGIGLELFLLSRDPWRVVLSTDHPNGGSFLSYPRLIRLLMDREFRNEQIGRVNKQAMKRTVLLDDLDREYTLEEIAIITRAGPARLLGLRDKGHLGVGADADITVYDDRADREEMFSAPRYVIKDGHAVVEDGELRETGPGRLLRVGAEYDPSIEPTLEELFEDRYSVRFSSYPVREPWLLEPARTVAAEGSR